MNITEEITWCLYRAKNPLKISDLQEQTGLAYQQIARGLNLLKEEGYVIPKKIEGGRWNMKTYSLNKNRIKTIKSYLKRRGILG